MIIYLLKKIDDEEFDFKKELKILSKKYPNVDLKVMGFTDDWEEIVLCR
jgi:abortive infection bacteriophage resistance protein